MKKNELTVKGTQKFMGIKIPVVYGGFGADQKCVCDKTAGEIHGMEAYKIRERITGSIKRFREGVDFLDFGQRLRQTDTSSKFELLQELGYSKQAIAQAEHIYILSERGYLKLVKILDSDEAWNTYENLVDQYFEKEQQSTVDELEKMDIESRNLRAEAMRLNAKTKIAKMVIDAYKEAEVEPRYQVLALNEIYSEVGIHLPLAGIEIEEPTFDKQAIAERLGVLSKSGKPHPQAVGAIIAQINVTKDEVIRVPFVKNGHSGSCEQYRESVVQRVADWLRENDYPTIIHKDDRTKLNVRYQMMEK